MGSDFSTRDFYTRAGCKPTRGGKKNSEKGTLLETAICRFGVTVSKKKGLTAKRKDKERERERERERRKESKAHN